VISSARACDGAQTDVSNAGGGDLLPVIHAPAKRRGAGVGFPRNGCDVIV
jgi:hypothetical protein